MNEEDQVTPEETTKVETRSEAQLEAISKLGTIEETRYGKLKYISIRSEMEKSYLDYAMSVIVSRALPDVRDGSSSARF